MAASLIPQNYYSNIPSAIEHGLSVSGVLMFMAGEPSQVMQPGTVITTNSVLHDIPPAVQVTIPVEAILALELATS